MGGASVVTAPADAAASTAPVRARRAAEDGRLDLASAADLAGRCRACELWERATRTVFGAGARDADLMLVGEQPGDQEDRVGLPFVGPAGRILDESLRAAGIDRERVFLTNVVKHFRWKPAPGSRRRLHERPAREHIEACLPWVETELELVRPTGLVLLGATAAGALLGPAIRVTRDRGRPLESPLAPLVMTTIHPSAVLRAGEGRAAMLAGLVADLTFARERVDGILAGSD
jgi:DNA polymerase